MHLGAGIDGTALRVRQVPFLLSQLGFKGEAVAQTTSTHSDCESTTGSTCLLPA